MGVDTIFLKANTHLTPFPSIGATAVKAAVVISDSLRVQYISLMAENGLIAGMLEICTTECGVLVYGEVNG